MMEWYRLGKGVWEDDGMVRVGKGSMGRVRDGAGWVRERKEVAVIIRKPCGNYKETLHDHNHFLLSRHLLSILQQSGLLSEDLKGQVREKFFHLKTCVCLKGGNFVSFLNCLKKA